MSYNFCLACGALLSPHVYECPFCEFDNSFGHCQDIFIDDDFLSDLYDDVNPEDETGC
ncbi:hypothetical protein SAMN04487931_11153 [Desulfobacula phenolica]|uniref:Uncharacterized protein n=1 Tax=Desulfobacula phenolica TaxID=90732 RepID=A0A1H2J8S7_9BACT|nr:hypothetical protein SAMN04487931_11153 [Desulfobacula phenolica]